MNTSGGLSYKSSAGRWVIAATVLGSGMAAIDATVVGIALPTIGRDFHAALGTLQWVVTGYTLTLAALLLLGGSLGDRYGRRQVYCIGVVWFALSSAACGFAPDSDRADRRPGRPRRRSCAAHARAAWRSWRPRSPRTTVPARSAPGRDSEASPRRRARCWVAT